MKFSPQRCASIAVVLTCAVGLAGCGSDDNGSSATDAPAASSATTPVPQSSSGTEPSSATEPSSNTAAGGGDCLAAATAAVDAARSPMKIAELDPIDATSLAGKNVWVISPDESIVYTAGTTAAIKQAGEAAGMTVTIFDGKSSPDLFNQGLATAVAQKADAVVLYAIDTSLVSGPLADAASAGIPVVNAFNGPVGEATPGVYANVSHDAVQVGKNVADYLLERTGCTANVLDFTSPLYSSLTLMANSVTAEVAALCPDDCKVEDVEIDFATLATSTGPLASNSLQRNPDVNAIVTAFDGLITFISPAAEALGRNVPIVGQAATNENLDQIRAGALHAADVIYAPAEYAGWLIFDEVLRGMLGAPATANTVPIQLFDKSSLPASNDLAQIAPGLVGYQDAFKTAWGL